jgi:hypothetical protein
MEQPPWPLQAIALENVGEGAVADVLAQNLRAALQEAHRLIRRVKLDLHPCAIHRGVSGLASARFWPEPTGGEGRGCQWVMPVMPE